MSNDRTETVTHTFDPTDPAARVTIHGIAYRADQVRRAALDTGAGMVEQEIVYFVRQTRTGSDFKNGAGIWLSSGVRRDDRPDQVDPVY
jgi:hypothetical protein